MRRDVYSGTLKLKGEEHLNTLIAANNYASSLHHMKRFEEARWLLRKTMPVARRVLGDNHEMTLKMRWIYARVLYMDEGASLDDRREAVATLESVAHSWKRIFGPAHPETPKAQGGAERGARGAGRKSGRARLPGVPGPTGTPSPRRVVNSPIDLVRRVHRSFLRLELRGMLGLLRTVFISHLSHIRIRIVSGGAGVARRPVRRHVL